MPAQKGRELLLQVDDGAGSYVTVGGFKSNSFSINGNAVDITNKDSGGFRASLDGGATISIDTEASGVFMDDAQFEKVHTAAISGTHLDARVTIPDFMTYTGPFTVPSLQLSGDTEGAITYNIRLASAGQITAAVI